MAPWCIRIFNRKALPEKDPKMAELSHQEAVDLARAAAEQLQRAADVAQAYADAAAVAAHNATAGAIDPFVFRFSIFVLALFVGYYVVWSLTPALHTPLMPVTNAISSVIVVGALLAVGVQLIGSESGPILARVLRFIVLVVAAGDKFGGVLGPPSLVGVYPERKKRMPPAWPTVLDAFCRRRG